MTATLTEGERVRVPASVDSWWAGDADVVSTANGMAVLKFLTGNERGYTGTFKIGDLERLPQVGDTVRITAPQVLGSSTIAAITSCSGSPVYHLNNGKVIDTCFGDRTVDLVARAPQPPTWRDGDVITLDGVSYGRRGSASRDGVHWSPLDGFIGMARTLSDSKVNSAFRADKVVHLVRDGQVVIPGTVYAG